MDQFGGARQVAREGTVSQAAGGDHGARDRRRDGGAGGVVAGRVPGAERAARDAVLRPDAVHPGGLLAGEPGAGGGGGAATI